MTRSRGTQAQSGWGTAVWTLIAATALLWPSRVVGPLDGMPLDQRSDALVIGLLIPALWWCCREVMRAGWLRAVVIVLLAWKVFGTLTLTQQGLCAAAYAPAPWDGTTQTIRVAEPSGALRSWDVRADWQAAVPRCTAILTRPLPDSRDFPAWFVNITDQMFGRRDIQLTLRGFVTVDAAGELGWGTAGEVTAPDDVQSVRLATGTQPIEHRLHLAGERWQLTPTIDGRPLFGAALVTTDAPRAIDRAVAPWGWAVAPLLVVTMTAGLALAAWRRLRPSVLVTGWTAAATGVAIALAFAPAPAARGAGLIALGACALRMPTHLRNLRGAFLTIGVPWLAFFATWSLDRIGRFSIYSYDDWLAYQVAGYRIFMNGFWLEAGTPTFDYQPLYRWITGTLHLIFGDSSVGEVYLDAAALLSGALLSFSLTRAAAGFRWGLAAAGATLATFTLGTPWHFLGRGLSEIAAAGFSFLAAFFLLRSRRGSASWTLAGGAAAVLMVYTRLNHLLWAPFLAAYMLPLRTPAVARTVGTALKMLRPRRLAALAACLAAGLLLLALRTWHYTGVFSLFYGTSLRHNDTGLRPWTLFDPQVWSKVVHSLASFVSLTEPVRPDPRALVMAAGVVAWVAAVVQLPPARRIPAALLIVSAGAVVGAFFAHGHPYPGRFSIHAVPLASAMAFIAAQSLAAGPRPRAAAPHAS
jgi:hypothetical protein